MGINGHIEWWGILLWALASLFYISLVVHIITSIVLQVILDKFSEAVDLWNKATSNKVTYLKKKEDI